MAATAVQRDEATPASAALPSAIFAPPDSSPSEDDSHEEEDEVALLPRHTKVLVIGNNRTKQSLVGMAGVVKKAVGLGGWHWLVGRFALRVISSLDWQLVHSFRGRLSGCFDPERPW